MSWLPLMTPSGCAASPTRHHNNKTNNNKPIIARTSLPKQTLHDRSNQTLHDRSNEPHTGKHIHTRTVCTSHHTCGYTSPTYCCEMSSSDGRVASERKDGCQINNPLESITKQTGSCPPTSVLHPLAAPSRAPNFDNEKSIPSTAYITRAKSKQTRNHVFIGELPEEI